VVMVWTPCGDARHIMSMRYAHAKEQRVWKKEIDRFRWCAGTDQRVFPVGRCVQGSKTIATRPTPS